MTMTPTNGAEFIPELWAKEIQENRRNKLVVLPLVDHQYESQLLSQGDTVHIVSLPDLSAQTITPGTEMTVSDAEPDEQLLVVNQYKGVPVRIQDMLKKQSAYELRAPYVDRISFALSTAIDSYILGLWNSFNTANKPAAVSSLSFNTIVDAHQILDSGNVPVDGRALIVNGVGLADLRKVAEFTLWDHTGRAGLVESTTGIVGMIYNTPVYVTEAVPTSGGAFKFLLLHKSAIAVAVQLAPEVEYDRNILMKADIIAGSTLFGAKVVRPDSAVVISRTVPTTTTTTTA